MKWFKVKDNSYVDLHEVCAVKATSDNRTVWIYFKNGSDIGFEVHDASHVVNRITNLLTAKEG